VTEYLQRMARYNAWANRRLFAQVAELPGEIIAEDRGAFFGSILGTLNHIFVVDILWLGRFASCEACMPISPLGIIPAPTSLRDILFDEMTEFCAGRERLDELIVDFSKMWDAELMPETIRYTDMGGRAQMGVLCELLQHMFNHQTHHRGQVTTLLSQADINPAELDLLFMLREEEARA